MCSVYLQVVLFEMGTTGNKTIACLQAVHETLPEKHRYVF